MRRTPVFIKVATAVATLLGSDFTTGVDGLFQECNPALALGGDVQVRVRRPDVEDVVTTAALRKKLTVLVMPVAVLP